jgi:hypothetical protein
MPPKRYGACWTASRRGGRNRWQRSFGRFGFESGGRCSDTGSSPKSDDP